MDWTQRPALMRRLCGCSCGCCGGRCLNWLLTRTKQSCAMLQSCPPATPRASLPDHLQSSTGKRRAHRRLMDCGRPARALVPGRCGWRPGREGLAVRQAWLDRPAAVGCYRSSGALPRAHGSAASSAREMLLSAASRL